MFEVRLIPENVFSLMKAKAQTPPGRARCKMLGSSLVTEVGLEFPATTPPIFLGGVTRIFHQSPPDYPHCPRSLQDVSRAECTHHPSVWPWFQRPGGNCGPTDRPGPSSRAGAGNPGPRALRPGRRSSPGGRDPGKERGAELAGRDRAHLPTGDSHPRGPGFLVG